MNADLKNFLQPIALVIATAVFTVLTVAFLALPYLLEQHPGDPLVPTQQSGPRHMT
jgi:hypothetical protein